MNCQFMKRVSSLCPLWFALFCWQAEAQIYDTNNEVVQTFAGSGFYGYINGQGTQTMFNHPSFIVADSSSNLFVLDAGNYRVRKITPSASVSTFAGGGSLTTGYGTNVALNYLFGGMAIDHSNVLWIVAYNQSFGSGYLLRVGNDAYVSKTNLNFTSSYGVGGYDPIVSGVCVDSENNVYYSDCNGNRVYRYQQIGTTEVFAGSGNPGSADGNGVFPSFYWPAALACDAADNIYVWDSGNTTIRRINQNRDVVTIAGGIRGDVDGVGTNAGFRAVGGMCVDAREMSPSPVATGGSPVQRGIADLPSAA